MLRTFPSKDIGNGADAPNKMAVAFMSMFRRGIAFRNLFIQAYQNSDFTSYRSLSLAAGASPSRVQKIVSGELDNSAGGPRLFLIDDLCRKMGVTPNDLLGYDRPQVPQEEPAPKGIPTVERLMRCYVRSSAHISGFSPYLNFCQVYAEPKEERIHLIHSGPLSLASRTMQTTDVAILQEEFDGASEENREKIYAGQRRAWDNGVGVEPTFIDMSMPHRGKRARFDFLRAAFRVSTGDCERLLVYCELIEQ